ncbi:MAG TPA: O-antigen ligase family protein [Patescibacteria group bacterium]|nr:O-antigen ligase family protein [Patescibacteria group bacterium]
MSNDNDSPASDIRSCLLTIPLLWLAFAAGLFYTGTDSIWLAPALASALPTGIVLLMPGVRSGWHIPRTPVLFLTGISWLYLLVSVFWSTSPFVSELFLAALSFQPWPFLALTAQNDGGRTARLHAAAMLAAIAAVAAAAIGQFLFLYRDYGPRIHYPFLDPNDLAALINIGLLPALVLFMTAAGRRAILFGFLAVMLYGALLVTQSRGGLLCACIGFAMLLPFIARPLLSRAPKLLAMLGAIILVPLLMQIYTHMVFGGTGIAFNLLSHDPVSVTDRLALWHSTWAMIAHHPVAGTGLGTFYFYYSGYRLPSDRSDGFFAHMDALQLWSEAGIAALILFYALYAAVAMRTLRAIRPAPADQYDVRARMVASFAAFTAVFLHSHITFITYLPALGVPLGVLLAVWHADTETILGDGRMVLGATSGRFRIAAFAAVTVLAAVAGQWAVGGALDVHYIERAATAEARGDRQAMRDAVDHAERFAPGASSRPSQYEARWRALALKQDKNLSGPERKKLYEEGLAHIERAMKLNPAFSYLRTVRARLYMLGQQHGLNADGYDRAEDDLQYVLKADPLCLEARYMLAEIYKRQGEISRAKNALGEGLNWPRPKGQPEIDLLANVALLCKETGDDACYTRLIAEAAATAQRYKLKSAK